MVAEVRVLAPNAAKESVTEAISVFEKATGHKVVIAWSGTEAITKRIAEGEVVDVVVNAAQNIDRQSKDGKLAAATRTDFARSGIGVAVPEGRRISTCPHPTPDQSSLNVGFGATATVG